LIPETRRLRKTLHKQTDRQTDRHYENNAHLAVNQQYDTTMDEVHEEDDRYSQPSLSHKTKQTDTSGMSLIDRRYTSFYRHSVVSLALDCFVSEISLVLYRKCHFCTYHPKFGDVPLELDR